MTRAVKQEVVDIFRRSTDVAHSIDVLFYRCCVAFKHQWANRRREIVVSLSRGLATYLIVQSTIGSGDVFNRPIYGRFKHPVVCASSAIVPFSLPGADNVFFNEAPCLRAQVVQCRRLTRPPATITCFRSSAGRVVYSDVDVRWYPYELDALVLIDV